MDIQFRETKALWEGALEQPALAYARGADEISASIGEPFQWADGEMLGGNWKPPVGGNRFYLLQLAFTLSPRGNIKVTSADFCLTLGKQGDKKAVVFDAFPREQTIATDDSVTLGIGPDFKFGTTDASLAKAEAKFDLGSVIPVVHVEGLQESKLCWRYSEHAKYPLAGSRRMVAIVSLPDGMKTTLATLSLTVSAEGRFGPFRVSPPEIEQARLRWVVGEK
ncbi:MAG: hypothetical protein IPO36_18550 [Anaerolineales bacterium]|nr:hypothetical protein [Anaerolineales bacterium]